MSNENSKNLVLIVLTNNVALISDATQVVSELGDPDLLLSNPFLINSNLTLEPWLNELSGEKSFKIHSDKVLTITEPNSNLIKKYQSLTK